MSAAIVAQLPGIEAGRLADGRTRPDWPVASADLTRCPVRHACKNNYQGAVTWLVDRSLGFEEQSPFPLLFRKSHNGPVPFRAPLVAGIRTVFRSLLYP